MLLLEVRLAYFTEWRCLAFSSYKPPVYRCAACRYDPTTNRRLHIDKMTMEPDGPVMNLNAEFVVVDRTTGLLVALPAPPR
jgi:hypothetical protein